MHTQTGEILSLDEVHQRPEAEQRKFVGVTDEEAVELGRMNRKQRRTWFAQQRRAGRKFVPVPVHVEPVAAVDIDIGKLFDQGPPGNPDGAYAEHFAPGPKVGP